MQSTDTRHLVMPTVAAGVLMAAYLLMRPYGDATSSTSPEAAAAFASGWWVAAHMAGALALVQLARIGLRIDDVLSTTTTKIARWSGLAGVVLVLPFYGAETFGLHAIGRLGLTDPTVLPLVEDVRGHPAALTTFGIGLVLLAVSGVSTALAWQKATRTGRWAGPAWAAWPLGVGATLVMPQFSLPPTGRMAFGVAFGIAALIFAWTANRSSVRMGEDPRLAADGPEPATTAP